MPLLGHAGGIDEILFVAVPIVVFYVVYRLTRGEGRGKEAPPEDRADRGASPRREPR